jgi:hypothetical protein
LSDKYSKLLLSIAGSPKFVKVPIWKLRVRVERVRVKGVRVKRVRVEGIRVREEKLGGKIKG